MFGRSLCQICSRSLSENFESSSVKLLIIIFRNLRVRRLFWNKICLVSNMVSTTSSTIDHVCMFFKKIT